MGDVTEVLASLNEKVENEKSVNEVTQAAEAPNVATDEKSITERRRRLRTKLSAPVRVRLNSGAQQQAEVCTTVDASRDGLLFTSTFAGYRRGQDLAITFPYSGTAGGVQHERTALVARVFEMPEGRYGIGIRFYEGKRPDLNAEADRAAGKHLRNAGQVARDLEKPMPLVLIVESDSRSRDTMRNVLQDQKYVVEAVETGAQAVEFLRQRTPNLLLTEIEIEDMSGYDLCLIVKSNERLQHVPVVMTTRRGQPNDYSTAHALGAIVCMAKPYKQERLLHVVRMLAPPTVSEEPAMKSGMRSRVSHTAPAHRNGNSHSNGRGAHARR